MNKEIITLQPWVRKCLDKQARLEFQAAKPYVKQLAENIHINKYNFMIEWEACHSFVIGTHGKEAGQEMRSLLAEHKDKLAEYGFGLQLLDGPSIFVIKNLCAWTGRVLVSTTKPAIKET